MEFDEYEDAEYYNHRADSNDWLMRVIYRKGGEREFELRTP